jgi:hypothetical protein
MRSNLVMTVAGTRPEAIKLAPVFWWLEKLGVDYVFVWSGQHYDYEMSRVFFEQLKLPEPDVFLDVGVQASNASEQVGLLIQKIAGEMKKIRRVDINSKDSAEKHGGGCVVVPSYGLRTVMRAVVPYAYSCDSKRG